MSKEVTTYKSSIRGSYVNPLDLSRMYYSILSVVGKMGLTERELDLLSYIATKGTISSVSSREEFIKTFNSSKQTINNIVSHLKKLGILYKDKQSKVRINPKLLIGNETSEILLSINLNSNLNSNGESK
jgi:hypothetical protein